MAVDGDLHDIRSAAVELSPMLDPDDYAASQALAANLRRRKSEGIVYMSVRNPGGECAALFYPDCASDPLQGRHLDYHWDGQRVDLIRDAGSGDVFRIVDVAPGPI